MDKKLKDSELETVTGGGEFIGFVDSDDYEEKETYETAYKSTVKEDYVHPPIKGRT